MVNLHTPLCDLLGIRHPILLAGMAGGPNTPTLVGAVSRGGGLGVLGISGTTVQAARDATREALRESGGAPIGVNVQLAPPTPPTVARERMLEILAPFRQELGLPREPAPRPRPDPPHELLQASLEAGARVVTTWHDPASVFDDARAVGAPVVAMTTTVDGGVLAVQRGADGVIAQGAEAGGHRSTFGAEGRAASETGTLALVPQMVAALGADVPVVASGGIADGRGVAAALLMGAAGVSLGTIFMAAIESGVSEVHRAALRDLRPEDTVVTDAVTGRPARWIRNRIVQALIDADAGTLGWGAQGVMLADIREAAARQGRADLLPMLAGQAAALSPAEPCPADLILADLVAGTHAALASRGT